MERAARTRHRASRRILAIVAAGLAAGSLGAPAATAAEVAVLSCRTDKPIYTQGENVILTVANMSGQDVSIIDRSGIDAGVATIERRDAENGWNAIELYAAAAPSVFKVLKPGEQHVYVWSTIGYNRSDTVAPEGTYRIHLGNDAYSNTFEIRRPE